MTSVRIVDVVRPAMTTIARERETKPPSLEMAKGSKAPTVAKAVIKIGRIRVTPASTRACLMGNGINSLDAIRKLGTLLRLQFY